MAIPKIGARGLVREFNTNQVLAKAEVTAHQDAGEIPGCIGIKLKDGGYIGNVHAASPGSSERCIFSTENVIVHRPDDATRCTLYEWFDLVW